jgi:hypothetical protein
MPKRRLKRHSVTQPSDPSYRLIPLTRGQNAIVDTADYNWLNQWNWSALPHRSGKFYAMRNGYTKGKKNCETILMHRVILGCKDDELGDHKDHNTLNNRKSNLRITNYVGNGRNSVKKSTNTTGFRGITSYITRRNIKRWVARIRDGKTNSYIGCYESAKEAAKAYDEAAKRIHGEFASLNFPD